MKKNYQLSQVQMKSRPPSFLTNRKNTGYKNLIRGKKG